MKTVFKILLVAAVIGVLIAAPVSAASRPDLAGYMISNYDVHIVIAENNVYDVTETIAVHFTEPRHGIYRTIPVKGTLSRTSMAGEQVQTPLRASVSNVAVEDYDYSVSRDSNDVVIKIGSADYTVDGDQTYRISYKYKYGDDGTPKFDEVYHNIIGTEWDTTIDHVTFSVELPKPFDPELLGFSMGGYGSEGYNPADLKFNVDGNTVTGSTQRQLTNYEGLTMRLELPQGYFKVPDPRIPEWLLMGLYTVMMAGSALLFFLYGRDDKPVKTVEFYAPDGMTPAEIGYVNDGCVDNRDVVSLVMYWADKGYLTIEDTGGGGFTLHKIKDPHPEAKNFEQHMFTKLFKFGSEVTTSDLKYTFYKTVASTKTMVEDSFDKNDRRVFTKVSMALKPLLSFVTALPVMITLWVTMYRDNRDLIETLLTGTIVGLIILLPVFFMIGTMRRWRADKPAIRWTKLLCSLFLCFLALVFFLILTADTALVPGMPWTAAIATAVIGLVAVFISRRTPKGVEWLGKIMGFRDFIVLAERDKLLAMVEQNPNYFYNILPYAYVLNVTDKWAKNFETIAIQPPDWYYGYGTFHSPLLFVNSLNHSMNSVQSMMVSTPSSRGGSGGGGGGFSGGGFSGGGGGGGGGGSW